MESLVLQKKKKEEAQLELQEQSELKCAHLLFDLSLHAWFGYPWINICQHHSEKYTNVCIRTIN